jgi:hypothetical protein
VNPVNVVMVLNPGVRPDDAGNLVSFLAKFRTEFCRPVMFIGFRSHPSVERGQIYICEENEEWLNKTPKS